MPNLRAVGARYYDYLDHSLPVTDRSLVEAMGLCNLRATRIVPRFLPYGTNPAGVIRGSGEHTLLSKGLSQLRTPRVHSRLTKTYIRLPFLWRIFGGQMLVVATAD